MTKPKTILLMAAHGSSHPVARQALEGFTERVRTKHAGLSVFLAYTALQRPGCHPAGLAGNGLIDVLTRLGSVEPLDLRVQSLHVIAGDEFDRMRETLTAFAASQGAEVTISGPLLAGLGDVPDVAGTLAESLSPGASGQAVVLMGHGTTHEAQDLYHSLAARLGSILPNAHLGVLEAADPHDPLSIKAIARDLASKGVREVRLVPFLTVAGRHAHKDMAGGHPDSWKSVLERHNIAAIPDLAGLVERDGVVGLWFERLKQLMAR